MEHEEGCRRRIDPEATCSCGSAGRAVFCAGCRSAPPLLETIEGRQPFNFRGWGNWLHPRPGLNEPIEVRNRVLCPECAGEVEDLLERLQLRVGIRV